MENLKKINLLEPMLSWGFGKIWLVFPKKNSKFSLAVVAANLGVTGSLLSVAIFYCSGIIIFWWTSFMLFNPEIIISCEKVFIKPFLIWRYIKFEFYLSKTMSNFCCLVSGKLQEQFASKYRGLSWLWRSEWQ